MKSITLHSHDNFTPLILIGFIFYFQLFLNFALTAIYNATTTKEESSRSKKLMKRNAWIKHNLLPRPNGTLKEIKEIFLLQNFTRWTDLVYILHASKYCYDLHIIPTILFLSSSIARRIWFKMSKLEYILSNYSKYWIVYINNSKPQV